MMHLVTYTINPKRDITQLILELQRSASWCHSIDEAWVIISNETTADIWNRLAPYFVATDRVLIVEIVMESAIPAGWQPEEVWKWIDNWKNSISGARSVK